MLKNYIDIKAEIEKSESPLLKKLPSFIINGLVLLVRQKEINRILNKYSEVDGYEFLLKVFDELNITIDVQGIENLPASGKNFFIANHPFGIVDGLILTYLISKKYGSFKAIGNQLFMLIPQLRPYIAAVNPLGTTHKESLRELNDIYMSDYPVTHFPAGKVSRIKNWKVQDDDWHKSFVSKAVSCKRDIVPIYFHGRNSFLFYFIFLFRKSIGIKTNLELALLPHEIFNKKGKTIRVVIGEPISYKVFDKTRTHSDWTQYLKQLVYRLGA